MNCPHCGRGNDATTDLFTGAERPQPGNISLCIRCAQWAIFTDTGLRKPTSAEYVRIFTDPNCKDLMAALRTAKGWD